MNISGSECSSDCESGWTMYLGQHTNSEDQYNRNVGGRVYDGKDYRSGKVAFSSEDEDSSMLSDASSGPPHFHDVEECYVQTDYVCYSSASEHKKGKQEKKTEEQRGENQNCYLDDTASSPAMSFPMENVSSYNGRTSMEHIPGISETHFKGKSFIGKHFGFLKSSSKTAPK